MTATTTYRGGSLDVRDLHMAFGSLQVLRGVSISVPAASITCVIGPSGYGQERGSHPPRPGGGAS